MPVELRLFRSESRQPAPECSVAELFLIARRRPCCEWSMHSYASRGREPAESRGSRIIPYLSARRCWISSAYWLHHSPCHVRSRRRRPDLNQSTGRPLWWRQQITLRPGSPSLAVVTKPRGHCMPFEDDSDLRRWVALRRRRHVHFGAGCDRQRWFIAETFSECVLPRWEGSTPEGNSCRGVTKPEICPCKRAGIDHPLSSLEQPLRGQGRRW